MEQIRRAAREAARRVAVRAVDYAWILRAQVRGVRLGTPSAWDDGQRAPVLLIPGVYETWAVMEPLARALHEAGHPVHTVPALGFNSRDLAGSARLVAQRIHRLDLDRVILVAHSKGGLIGKLVLGDPWLGGRVAGLVAVNTPFAGSGLASWFPTRAVRALRPADPVVQALSRTVDRNARIVSLSAPFDPHVPGRAALRGATEVALPLDGHFRPLGDPRVHALVVEQVARLEASED
jgi:pimeloyl-ACP methyl ester carboxylesterase